MSSALISGARNKGARKLLKRPSSQRAKRPGSPENSSSKDALTGKRGLPLPSIDPATNFLITDIVLRAAGDFARKAVEKKTLAQTYDRDKAEELVAKQSIAKSVAIYAITRIATSSPMGLAVVAGGLTLKAFYNRGKSIEAREGSVLSKIKPPRLPNKK